MLEKFGLSFMLFSREQVEQSRSGNPFEDIDLMVARVDQLSRNEDLQEKLRLTRWDLVVVDEAHKLSASYFGNKVNKTKRFQLGELLGTGHPPEFFRMLNASDIISAPRFLIAQIGEPLDFGGNSSKPLKFFCSECAMA
jgi:hypothetical protein